MSFRFIALSIALCFLNACSTQQLGEPLENVRTEVVDYPVVGEQVTRQLGNRLAAKGYRSVGSGFVVPEDSCFGDCEAATCSGLTALSGQSAFLTRRLVKDSVSHECGMISMRVNLGWACGGLVVEGLVCFDPHGTPSVGIYPLTSGFIDGPKEMVKADKPNFVQEFVYNGRAGDHLKFIYREFSNDVARPAFTQEAQYDLSESSEIGFKNLLLEVVEASNTAITYKLKRNFSGTH